MEDLAIYATGGFAKEVACLIDVINKHTPTWNLIGFFDDFKPKGTKVSHYGEVLGGMDCINSYSKRLNVVIAIGNPEAVKRVYEQINNDNIIFPNIIHPNVKCADEETFQIGKGNIVQGDCFFSCDVKIGNFNVMNGNVVFGHDDVVGDFNAFMPAVRISGEVIIGELNYFGVGSIILQQIKIGNNIRLGAGSVLMTKPKNGNLYIGNPAKKFEF